MLWLITRSSKPVAAEIREKLRPAHHEYLRGQKRVLLLGASTQNDDGTDNTGTMFIVNAENREEALAFVDSDPLMQAGCFTDLKISRLRKGFWNPEVMESI